MKDKKVIAIFIVLGVIFTILGGSLAYWSWTSTNAEKTNVTFTVGATFSCSANGGGDITANNYFAPTDCDNATYAVKREITVNTTSTTANEIINLSMDLNIDNISSALLQTDYFKYALTKNANSCNGAISGGSFKDNYDSVNHTVPLLVDEEFIGTESKTYYLYIWLDKDETNSNTMNTSFSASLEGSCTDSGNVLKKVYAYLGTSSQYFKAAAYKDNITSVSFVNEVNIPGNATNWSVGVSPSNVDDVKAWLEDDGSNNNTFTLKIGSNQGRMYSKNLSEAFASMNYVETFDFSNLNTSETTNMANMFYYTGKNASTFNLNLGNNFDTSNVTNMRAMFWSVGSKASTFSFNLGNRFNTSNVTDMVYMFYGIGQNAQIFNLQLKDNFDTSKVSNMTSMFFGAGENSTDFSLGLGNGFNTSKVSGMQRMLSWIGRNATNWHLDLGNQFNTSNVTIMIDMFSEAGKNAIDFNLNLGNNFDTSNVTDMSYMFSCAGQNATNWNLNLGNKFNTMKVSNMQSMFYNAANKTITSFVLDLSDGDFTNVTINAFMFYGFGNNRTTIYVKDAAAQNFIIAQNSDFSASNVLIK